MLVHRNAAAIVRNRDKPVGIEAHFNEIGMSRNCFVHRVVDDFGEEVMQCLFVSAANVHAGTQTDRLQTFQNTNG